MKKATIYLAASVFLIFIDQFSKYMVRSHGGFYICNAGIAFGLNLSSIIIWIAILTLFFLAVNNRKLIIKNCGFWAGCGIIFLLSGALSNILDRLSFGCVIDFIDLKFWPVFNLADIFITAGAIMILIKIVRNRTAA